MLLLQGTTSSWRASRPVLSMLIAPFDESPCPVRIAWAGADPTIPYARCAGPMMAAVPDADLVVLPGVGHVPMVDNPALVAWTILQHTRYEVASRER